MDPTQRDPPMTENFVTQPDPTRGWTRPVSNSEIVTSIVSSLSVGYTSANVCCSNYVCVCVYVTVVGISKKFLTDFNQILWNASPFAKDQSFRFKAWAAPGGGGGAGGQLSTRAVALTSPKLPPSLAERVCGAP